LRIATLPDRRKSIRQACRKDTHYLRLWHQAGVRDKLHAVLLAELNSAGKIDWGRALIDASFAKAPLERRRNNFPTSHIG
jgi:hypothetical protein